MLILGPLIALAFTPHARGVAVTTTTTVPPTTYTFVGPGLCQGQGSAVQAQAVQETDASCRAKCDATTSCGSYSYSGYTGTCKSYPKTTGNPTGMVCPKGACAGHNCAEVVCVCGSCANGCDGSCLWHTKTTSVRNTTAIDNANVRCYFKNTAAIDAEAKGRNEGEAQGLKDGEAKGKEEGEQDGFKKGNNRGLDVGEAEGEKSGEAKGLAEGAKKALNDKQKAMTEAEKSGEAKGLAEGAKKALNDKQKAMTEAEKSGEAKGLAEGAKKALNDKQEDVAEGENAGEAKGLAEGEKEALNVKHKAMAEGEKSGEAKGLAEGMKKALNGTQKANYAKGEVAGKEIAEAHEGEANGTTHAGTFSDGEAHAAKREEGLFGIALFASAFMFMSVFGVLNCYNANIRMYAFRILNTTVSIFCAVLFFSFGMDLSEKFVFPDIAGQDWEEDECKLGRWADGYNLLVFKFAVFSALLLLFRVVISQIARYSSKFSDAEGRAKNRMEAAMLIAHMAGFAGINFFTTLQGCWIEHMHKTFFRFAGLPVFPMALFAGIVVIIVFDILGSVGKLCHANDKNKPQEQNTESHAVDQLRQEMLEDGENDATALIAAYVMAQSARFFVGGVVPSAEGRETWSQLSSHGHQAILSLYGFAIGFWLAGWIWVLFVDYAQKGKSKKLSLLRGSSYLASAESRHLSVPTLTCRYYWSRMVRILGKTLDMSAAWTFYYASQWCASLIFKHLTSYSREDMDGKTPWLAELATFRALIIVIMMSFFTLCLVFVLDRVADGHFGNRMAGSPARIFRRKLAGVGFLMGFSWEKMFSLSTEYVSAQSPHPLGTHCALLFGIVVLVIPAWLWYLIPMTTEDGHRFGFVARKVAARSRPLMDQQEYADRFGDMIATLQTAIPGLSGADEDKCHLTDSGYVRF